MSCWIAPPSSEIMTSSSTLRQNSKDHVLCCFCFALNSSQGHVCLLGNIAVAHSAVCPSAQTVATFVRPSHHSQCSGTFIDIHINVQYVLLEIVLLSQMLSILFLELGVQASWDTEDDASCILVFQAFNPLAYAISTQGVMWVEGDLESCARLQQSINGLCIPG